MSKEKAVSVSLMLTAGTAWWRDGRSRPKSRVKNSSNKEGNQGFVLRTKFIIVVFNDLYHPHCKTQTK